MVRDALGRTVVVHAFDMLGTAIGQVSMDAGTRLTLHDVAGKPIRVWDSRDHQLRSLYDALQRPTHLFVRQGSAPELLAERIVYGEAHPDALARNLRGRAYQHYDGAGVGTTEQYDFKGNLLLSSRQLAASYQQQPDWSPLAALADVAAISSAAAPMLEVERFTSSATYDALNRPITLTTPDKSVIQPVYNQANLLEQVVVNLRGAAAATLFVSNIDYDAKGQRERIAYGNGVTTSYAYDPLTFRLARLQTLRAATPLQDLFYTYDPAGNITAIRDDAQQTVYFSNRVVSPSAGYTYDALYRLIGADGREHIGQLAQPQPTNDDAPRTNQPHPGDGQALRRYDETYTYDEVGNILSLVHAAAGGNWTRSYSYNQPSLIEPARQNNRLSSTTVGRVVETYSYDIHGNMTSMSHLAHMDWDFKDQLQRVDLGGGGTAYYVYDATGQRIRKVIERIGGQIEERISLGGFEVYRVRNAGSLTLERETLHVMDDTRRIALVETKTVDTAAPPFTPAPIIRYQHDNHLGSASLELDANGQIISYEEYYPYGSTSYQAVRSGVEVSQKRYRYTGKERDEESGLYYHGARYYAPWLGRWTAADPAGLVDGVNLYAYVRANPIILRDTTGHQATSPEINNLFTALAAVRTSVSPQQFHTFVTKNEAKLFPLLNPFGYQGSRTKPEATLNDFDKAYTKWSNVLREANSSSSVGLPKPPSDEALRRRMWATAASDPIAAVVIGSGAGLTALLGNLLGFEQDPVKAAAAGEFTSVVVNTVGGIGANNAVSDKEAKGKKSAASSKPRVVTPLKSLTAPRTSPKAEPPPLKPIPNFHADNPQSQAEELSFLKTFPTEIKRGGDPDLQDFIRQHGRVKYVVTAEGELRLIKHNPTYNGITIPQDYSHAVAADFKPVLASGVIYAEEGGFGAFTSQGHYRGQTLEHFNYGLSVLQKHGLNIVKQEFIPVQGSK